MSVIRGGQADRERLLEALLREHGPGKIRVRIETDFGYETTGHLLRIETYPSPWLDQAGPGLFLRLVELRGMPICVERITCLEVLL